MVEWNSQHRIEFGPQKRRTYVGVEADEDFRYTQQIFVRVGDTEFDSCPFIRNTPVEDEEKNICV